MDRCHFINQYKDHVSLHPIDCPYENFRQYSKTGEVFMPKDLESGDLEKRIKAVEIVQKFFKYAVEVFSANIIRNVNNLLATLLPDSHKDIAWIGTTKQKVESQKLNLGY